MVGTGMEDRNGKEICVGDRLEYNNDWWLVLYDGSEFWMFILNPRENKAVSLTSDLAATLEIVEGDVGIL